MLISKRNLNFNNGMETTCFSSRLDVLTLVLYVLNWFYLCYLNRGGRWWGKKKKMKCCPHIVLFGNE